MAIIGFTYRSVNPPAVGRASMSDSATGWHELEWMELARMPRFWPGFVEAFLRKPDVRSDMIEYFGDLEGIPEAKMNEIMDDPIRHRDRLAGMIDDFQFDYELWQGAEDPFVMILENTPGYFDYTAQVIDDSDIYFRILELVTDETPKADSSLMEANRDTLRELATALGIRLNVLLNRREV